MVARMMRRFLALFRRRDAGLIARRAVRVNNRNPEAAARYERVHAILSRGR